jgi:hypothetical protein
MDPLTFDLDAPSQPECGVTRYSLRRFHAGELPADERTKLETHAVGCLDCQAVLEELKSDDAAFRTHLPFARFAAEQEKRAAAAQPVKQAAGRLWAWVMGGGVTLALCAAGAVVLMPRANPEQEVGERLKGRAPALGFVLKTDKGVRAGREGEKLHQGDQIQFMVRGKGADQSMVVLGIDGRGAVTVYHQGVTPKSTLDGASPLPDSVVLDDALGRERFFVLTADLPAERLLALAQAAAGALVKEGADLAAVERLPLDVPAEQDSILIEKVSR